MLQLGTMWSASATSSVLDGNSGGLDNGLGLFLDRLVGAEDGLPNHRAENAAEQGAGPENPDFNVMVR